jgi:hypothetical protein
VDGGTAALVPFLPIGFRPPQAACWRQPFSYPPAGRWPQAVNHSHTLRIKNVSKSPGDRQNSASARSNSIWLPRRRCGRPRDLWSSDTYTSDTANRVCFAVAWSRPSGKHCRLTSVFPVPIVATGARFSRSVPKLPLRHDGAGKSVLVRAIALFQTAWGYNSAMAFAWECHGPKAQGAAMNPLRGSKLTDGFLVRQGADERQAYQAWHLGTRGSDLSFDHLQSVARQTYVLPAADARLATGSAGRRGL